MANFTVGTLLIGNSENTYTHTGKKSLCVVLQNNPPSSWLQVGVVASSSYESVGTAYEVRAEYFYEITIEEYFNLFPEAILGDKTILNKFDRHYGCNTADMYDDLVNRRNFVAPTINPSELESLLSAEQRNELHDEIVTLLDKYNFHPNEGDESAVDDIITEWLKNKVPLIKMFMRHPNYNGKFQIVFDYDYERVTDKNAVYKFCNDLRNSKELRQNVLEEHYIPPFTYKECRQYYDKYDYYRDIMGNAHDGHGIISINGMNKQEVEQSYWKWRNLLQKYMDEGISDHGNRYTKESYETYMRVRDCLSLLESYTDNTLRVEVSDYLNRQIPALKTKAGQKTSRVVGKLCKMFNLDKAPDYNRRFAIYSDAINPLVIKRHTILSVHPVDYLTMSFGNSWASCHTIDFENLRGTPKAYHGEYSSGTLSYMLDGTSMVLYTVDASYNGNQYELQDKINRNMFHYGYDKLIQGRVYPQDNDGENGIYSTFREIVQKIMSECMEDGVNSWLVTKGTSECYNVTSSQGTHYQDYLNYENCNVSYYNKQKNPRKISIGHDPICPCCGVTHHRYNDIECDDCDER